MSQGDPESLAGGGKVRVAGGESLSRSLPRSWINPVNPRIRCTEIAGVRHEHKLQNYTAFVHLGCIRILLRQPAFMG